MVMRKRNVSTIKELLIPQCLKLRGKIVFRHECTWTGWEPGIVSICFHVCTVDKMNEYTDVSYEVGTLRKPEIT